MKLCFIPGGDVDVQMRNVLELLLRRKLVIRVDRMYKKPKPGKKRLAKWPKKLVPLIDRDLQVSKLQLHAKAISMLSSAIIRFLQFSANLPCTMQLGTMML